MVLIKFIVIANNFSKNELNVLLNNKKLISKNFALNNSIDNVIREIVIENIKLDPHWIITELIDAKNTENELKLYYGARIPFDTKTNFQWHPIQDTFMLDKIDQTAIAKTIQKL